MWAEFAQRPMFIGGCLQDLDADSEAPATEILAIRFDGTIFEVVGRDYSCAVNRQYAGVGGEDGWTVVTYPMGGFRFRPRKEGP